MATFQYGGQALIEGVLMRGRNALAVALRHPDGTILWAVERLDLGLRARRAMRLPFVRGLVLLYDTLVTGTRWLVRSATLQALALEEQEAAKEAAEQAAKEAARAAGPGGGVAGSLLGLLGLLAGAMVHAAVAVLAVARIAISAVLLTPARALGSCAAHSGYTDPDATSPGGPPDPSPAEQGLGKGYAVAVGGMLVVTFAFAILIFFLVPLFLAQITIGRYTSGFAFQLTEGVIRVVIFIGYLLLVARAKDVRRTFQYHGAEHMSIHTLEAGEPLTVDCARTHPTAHQRCGTEFLVVVLIVSILAFALVGSLPPLWLVLSRVILIPVIAAVSYEILQLGARHRSHALVRWLWSPGIWVQMITTRQPSDDMIEVAIVSLEQALDANGATIPAGSATFASRPLSPEKDLGAGSAEGSKSTEGSKPTGGRALAEGSKRGRASGGSDEDAGPEPEAAR
jgi:uncharacterized protein YqhQ